MTDKNHPRPRLLPALVIAVAATALAPPLGWAAQPHNSTRPGSAEAQLKGVLEKIAQTNLDAALDGANQLTSSYPTFRLGHLVRGDLLLARAKPITEFGNTGHAARERLDELRAEVSARLRAYSDHPPQNLVPRYLLQFAPTQQHAIVVDASRARVYVYENANGTPRLVEDYYTTLGKRGIEKEREGDQKTPIGVYEITSKIPGSKLPDLYGWGAFPINYPNAWDRMRGKTGYGIWLHGVPSDTYARAPAASDGCIALANPDIEELGRRVQVGTTPVIITNSIEWMAHGAWKTERESFLRQIEAWRTDWESLDTNRYLAQYSRDFRSDGMDIAAWRTHKNRVNAAKTWIKVSLENMSVFRSPGQNSPVVVTFDQDYRSNNLSQKTRKRQYWIQEEGRWKIAYESPIRRPVLAMPESFPAKIR